MSYTPPPPRDMQADAQFIESGGLKNWGCFAAGLFVLILLIFYVVVHALLSNLWGYSSATLWASLGSVVVVAVGAISLWLRSRHRQRMAQEQLWQEQVEKHR